MLHGTYILHYLNLIKLGLPIMVGQLGIIVLGFADTIMVGQYGTDDLAAASFVNNMFNLIIIFSTGFSYGLTPVVGRLFGQNRKEEIGRTYKNALLANTLIAVVLTLLMIVFYFNIHRLDQPEELLPLIKPYFLILLSSLFFILVFNAFKQFSDGITDTMTPMWILLSGNLLNILGNWILIYGKCGFPEMGLYGAGLATFFSRIYMAVISFLIFLFSRRYGEYRKGFFRLPFNRRDFLLLNKLGWPVGLQMGMETASFSFSTIMVGWLGTVALASHQVMITVGQMGFMLYYGMAAAVAVRVSVFHGQKDYQNVRRTGNAGFHLIAGMALLVCFSVLMMRNAIGSWFSDDPAIQLTFAQLTIPFAIYQLGDGLQCNFSNALRGIEDVRPVMVIAFIAYFVISLPAGYLFGFVFHMGLTGIWLSFPFGLTSAGLMFFFRFRWKIRKEAQSICVPDAII